jgi:uncharacterized LabA/DUF88 family protein
MLKVGIFFDGKSFYHGYEEGEAATRRVDFKKLADWLVSQVGGDHLFGAFYYTGVESSDELASPGLTQFLGNLERVPGYFVRRLARRSATYHCESCGATHRFSREREVDTSIVADLVRYTATGGLDIAVVVSGDTDLVPGADAVRELGKQLWVATWGDRGVSSRLRQAAFATVDLAAGTSVFASEGRHDAPSRPPGADLADDVASSEVFLEELERAEERFADGYVGVNFFVTRWRSDRLVDDPNTRRRILDQLVDDGLVEIFETDDGSRGVRIIR